MAIPKYDEITLPLLRVMGNGKEYHRLDLPPLIGDVFKLTEDERNLKLPSGQSTYLKNRTGWAGFHLRKAGLTEIAREGYHRITPEGLKFLATNPPKITRPVLMLFEQFRQYVATVKKRLKNDDESGTRAADTGNGSVAADEATPEERINEAFAELRETLVADLLARLSSIDPFRFEKIVLDLLVAMGYGGSRKEAAEVTQKTGDEGIDGVINEDRLGLDVIYVQAKRWKATVGRPEIQSFVGAIAGRKASKGVFITTSGFHENARAYAAGLHQKVILIDGQRLADLMIEHGIGVAEEHAYVVKKIDSDYFEES
jgi:restriction system protein